MLVRILSICLLLFLVNPLLGQNERKHKEPRLLFILKDGMIVNGNGNGNK